MLCVSWKDKKSKKAVIVVSTKADVSYTTLHGRGGDVQKPTVIHDYNLHMNGCDKMDQNLTYYSVIVVFCGRNGKFAAAKFAPFRNLLQILLLFMKNLSFHHFKTKVVFF